MMWGGSENEWEGYEKLARDILDPSNEREIQIITMRRMHKENICLAGSLRIPIAKKPRSSELATIISKQL